MFRIGKSISGIILVIVFLALAGLAMTFHNSDDQAPAQIIDSNLITQGEAIFGATVDISERLAENSLEANLGFGNKLLNIGRSVGNFIFSFKDKTPELNTEINTDALENIDLESLQLNNLDDGQLDPQMIVESSSEKFANAVNTFQEKIETFNTENNIISSVAEQDWSDGSTELSFLRYKKNESGAEIIISSKNGREYKIPLPFKFLAE